LEFNVPFQHKYGYIRDKDLVTITHLKRLVAALPWTIWESLHGMPLPKPNTVDLLAPLFYYW